MYNPFSLENKFILITGASSGIGRATAIECSKLGATCIITGRNEVRLQDTFNNLEGKGHLQITADLTKRHDLEQLVDSLPTEINGLVNNAGILITKPIKFIKDSDFECFFPTNVYAPVLLTKYLFKKKRISDESSIVFTSSLAAMVTSMGNSLYGMSKSAIMTFAKYCALEFAEKKIRVNSVHPGMVNTEMTANAQFSQEEIEIDKNKYPLKRYAEPNEIAWAIIYLLSDASKWVTGTQFVIDGGVHLV